MKIKNLAVAGLVAAGAGALAVRGLVKDKELVEEAKENGKKVIDGVAELGGTMKKAASSTVEELKDITVEKLEAFKKELIENPDKYGDTDSLIKDIDNLVAKLNNEKVVEDTMDQDSLGDELPVDKDITLDEDAVKDDTDDVEISAEDLKEDKENE